VGTTVTAQIVAFNTTALAMPLVAIGFVVTFALKEGVARHYGAMLMGLGLLFYGMGAMGEAMAPLRTNQSFAELLQSLQNPVLGMLAGAVFTALVQSSSATIGLAVVMATQGLLSLPAGIAILFGAKIGTGITAVLAGIGKPQDAKRAAVVHVLFNLLGAMLWLPFIPQLAAIAQAVSPLAADLQGVERLAAEVPRQIANAATIWAVSNTVIFLPFAAWFAKLATRIIPDRAVEQKELIRPRFLDDEVIQVPAMALERARMELGHMAELTDGMLAKVSAAFKTGDPCELSQQGDQVLVLREAVLAYLTHIGRSELSDTEAAEYVRLVAATGEIETMSTAIGRDLAPLVRALKVADITPSQDTAALLQRLLQTIQETARSGLRALLDSDEQAAQSVVAKRGAILDLALELQRLQAARLAQDDPQRLVKHRLQLEIVDRLRHIHGVAEDMALSVLPRSVLVGELAA
jgi:phosphate:Na+ symporter